MRNAEINQAVLHGDHEKLTQLHKERINLKKKRIQFSIPVYDYDFLDQLAKDSNSSIQYYITVILYNYLYSKRKLLGAEIESLKKSNFELHKIGVNINQIAKANNAGDMVELPINQLYDFITKHINKVKLILNESTDIY